MNLNSDFGLRAAVHAGRMPWTPSPVPGVERRMLERIGDEVARATSLVRYARRSRFPAHVHGGGEEILVLEGVFRDETGEFPAGSYVRNPPKSRHAPGSGPGCVLFVKLWQFDPKDRSTLRIVVGEVAEQATKDGRTIRVQRLHHDAHEDVRIETWAPGTPIERAVPGGAELLVIEGTFDDDAERFERWSWLRLPVGAVLRARAGPEGARVWVKQGHLAAVPPLPRA